VGAGDGDVSRFGPRWPVVPAWLRHGAVIFLVLLVVEYLVIPKLVGASKDLDLLGELNVGWLIAGIVLEAGSPFCYAMLTRSPCCSAGGLAYRGWSVSLCQRPQSLM
jgi:hypothetical protein